MATTRKSRSSSSRSSWKGLRKADLVDIYRTVYLSRRLDDREIKMKRQNQIYFQISGAGHELPLVIAGRLLDPARDWFLPYYRDRALCLALGMTPTEILLEAVGAAEDPNSGGRQMPCHWGHRDLNIITKSSCTGMHFLHAAGAAQVGRIVEAVDALQDGSIPVADDEIVFVSAGDGTTSEGEFWESLNTVCNLSLPVLYMIEDNGYAISTPVEVGTAGASISKLVGSFPNLKIIEFDGCDLFETWDAMRSAVKHLRAGKGPVLCHAHVIRPYSHSMSDSEDLYRPEEEREEERLRDPFHTLADWLVGEGILSDEELEALREEVDAAVLQATDEALAAEKPSPESALDFVYSPDVDPTGPDFETAPAFVDEKEGTMVDLLNACLKSEMARDPRIVVFGQDVADVSREEYADHVKGKGGVFKVTHGLQFAHGSDRVFNSPLAEANIIGRAVGMAARGLKPVVEIQFFDYIWPAYMQLRNELANFRWRSNNAFKAPIVVRVPIGGYLKGGAPYHSQSGEVLFTHIPGLRVVMPSTALDANGLLRTAIRCDDPVMFLEPKHLYRQTYNKSANPGDDYMIPFGKARLVREGSDLTIITYGSLVQRSVKAAALLAEEGIDVEILDLRSLSPYDWDAIATSVRKTSKALMIHEDHITHGYGAEIAARIADELFEYLDGPVRRVGSLDCFVAYEPGLEDAILPQVDDVAEAARDLHRY
ncbi:MAG: dehydrogenase [Deltaproteobacteria bacterium]|nr:MAG: dehydrogenase [Deltaproteobacteria bacterium]